VSTVLCDTSVVVKWFFDEPGAQTPAARQLVEALEDGLVDLKVLDLTYYEAGNSFGKLGASSAVVAGLLERIEEVCGPGIVLERHRWAAVADVAERAGLSFYDAAYVAVAGQQGLALVTADMAMIRAGGVLPSAYVETLDRA